VAYDREEATLGGCCVAAPIIVAGQVLASISVSVPVAQYHPAGLAPAVRIAARGLSRQLTKAR
jgi:DNA-binding IclR family transcriptional regulator